MTDPQTYTHLKELNKMTVSELKEQRMIWLGEALVQGAIDACRLVVRELGEAYEYRPGKFLVRWQVDKVIVDYVEMEGTYLTTQGRPSRDNIITVSLGLLTAKTGKKWSDHNKRVVYFAEGDNLTDRSSNNIFIPGPWVENIYDAVPRANDMVEKKGREIEDAEKTKLLKLMQAGQEA